MTEIQKTAAEIRKIAIQMNEKGISHFRMVRLSDRKWDLEARYQMLLRQAGLA